jgi:hypothetical protein
MTDVAYSRATLDRMIEMLSALPGAPRNAQGAAMAWQAAADACNASDDDLRTFAARCVSRCERYPAYAELAQHAKDRRMDTLHTDLVSVMDERNRHWLVPACIADHYTPYGVWLHKEAERIRRERGGPSFRARRLLQVARHETDEYDPFADDEQ